MQCVHDNNNQMKVSHHIININWIIHQISVSTEFYPQQFDNLHKWELPQHFSIVSKISYWIQLTELRHFDERESIYLGKWNNGKLSGDSKYKTAIGETSRKQFIGEKIQGMKCPG